MSKFNIGDSVVVNSNYPDAETIGKIGVFAGVNPWSGYCVVNGIEEAHLFNENELDKETVMENTVSIKDCAGNDVSVGDKIVYFTRSGSSMWPNTATVTEIVDVDEHGPYNKIRIKVDVTEKKMSGDIHRKATLESLRNAVKVDWK